MNSKEKNNLKDINENMELMEFHDKMITCVLKNMHQSLRKMTEQSFLDNPSSNDLCLLSSLCYHSMKKELIM